MSHASDAVDFVPAAECTPQRIADNRKAELIDGVWQFRSNQKGTFVLECPIETLGTITPYSFGAWVLIYHDGDGQGTASNATFNLMNRSVGLGIESLESFDSNDIDTDLPNVAFFLFVDDSEPPAPIQHTPGAEFWYVRVALNRNQTTDEIRFGGFILGD